MRAAQSHAVISYSSPHTAAKKSIQKIKQKMLRVLLRALCLSPLLYLLTNSLSPRHTWPHTQNKLTCPLINFQAIYFSSQVASSSKRLQSVNIHHGGTVHDPPVVQPSFPLAFSAAVHVQWAELEFSNKSMCMCFSHPASLKFSS